MTEFSIQSRTLSREFLTWLWYKSEERGGSVFVPGQGDVAVVFHKRVILEAGDGEYTETVLCQGLHADLKEGKAALREGKKVREARLLLGKGHQEWEFTFKGDGFVFQSMRLPRIMSQEEEESGIEGRLLERLYLMEVPLQIMESLFTVFIERRLGTEWISEDLPSLRSWIGVS